LVHANLKEYPLLSYSKFKWMLTILDDYTSYAWVCLLKKKSETAPRLKDFFTTIKNQFNFELKTLRTDNGREFMSGEFQGWLCLIGALHENSAPHVHQQNGQAEQIHRMIHTKMQSLRKHSCILDGWWEFAIIHATKIYNHTPMSQLNWMTPYKLFVSQKPDISKIKVFSCAAHIFIPDEVRKNTLSPKTELMIHLGHTLDDKNYVFMRLPRNTLFKASQAIFAEEHYPKCKQGDHIALSGRILPLPPDRLETVVDLPDNYCAQSNTFSPSPDEKIAKPTLKSRKNSGAKADSSSNRIRYPHLHEPMPIRPWAQPSFIQGTRTNPSKLFKPTKNRKPTPHPSMVPIKEESEPEDYLWNTQEDNDSALPDWFLDAYRTRNQDIHPKEVNSDDDHLSYVDEDEILDIQSHLNRLSVQPADWFPSPEETNRLPRETHHVPTQTNPLRFSKMRRHERRRASDDISDQDVTCHKQNPSVLIDELSEPSQVKSDIAKSFNKLKKALAPPPAPEPVRERPQRHRQPPRQEGNVYGETTHPVRALIDRRMELEPYRKWKAQTMSA
jgi:hypothetical protein